MASIKAESIRFKLGTYLLISSSLILFFEKNTLAQSNIVPDNTLGTENSVVNPNFNDLPVELITGGAQRGQNLFHSFLEFNISEGRGAYFSIPNADITNILSRVTGSNVSEILGILGTIGESQPNLFLINPNGIIFGENASLDVGGSFVATSANSVQFGEQGFFSATEPDAPPLLTVNPSAFFFNQVSAGSITNNSVAPAGVDPSGLANLFGLRVPDGQSLFLLGGNINVSGGLFSVDGKIELASASGTGIIELDSNSTAIASFPDNLTRGDITINGGVINTGGATGGAISIYANNLDILQGGFLGTGIVSGFGSAETQAGDITVNATEAIALSGSGSNGSPSAIANIIQPGAVGDAGDINLVAKDISLKDGGQILANTFGRGNSGDINIETDTLTLDGVGSNGLNSLIFSGVGEAEVGDAGDISIVAKDFSLKDGAQISTSNFGAGNGGDISIEADTISFDGVNNVFNSGIFSIVQIGTVGDAGTIAITAREFSVTNGAQVNAITSGIGNGGDINIKTDTLLFDGESNGFVSGFFSSVGGEGIGDAGDINIVAEEFLLTNGAQLNSRTLGAGDGGNLTLQTTNLTVTNGAFIDASTSSEGRAGDIEIMASEAIAISGTRNDTPSGIYTDTLGTSTTAGDAGDLNLTTPNLTVSEQAQISASTSSAGNAGNLNLTAPNLTVSEQAQILTATSSDSIGDAGNINVIAEEFVVTDGAQLNSLTLGAGDGGNLTVQTTNLVLSNGGFVDASTFGEGRAGDIEIVASESIALSGTGDDTSSGIYTDTLGTSTTAGDAGDLNLTTPNLTVSDRAQISATTSSRGNGGEINLSLGNLLLDDNAEIAVNSRGNGTAGDINLQANLLTISDNSAITAETLSADGGNIDLQITDLLLLDNQSKISTTAGTAQAGGNGGNINLNTEFIVAFPNGNNDITANAFTGTGGNIDITAESIFGLAANSATPFNTTNDIDASSEFGLDGEISIETPDVDPARGLSNLPSDLVDASRLIARNCLDGTAEEKLNQFVITGRGGLPANPEGILSGDAILSTDWVSLPEVNSKPVFLSETENLDSQQAKQIIEAQGWIVGSQGQIILTAKPTQPQFKIPWMINGSCHNF